MKKAILITSAILLTFNIIFGLILSSYDWFNVAVSSGIIILTVFLCLLADRATIKDGFKVSLLVLFFIIGLIQYILAVFMPSAFTDNWIFIAIIVLFGIEAILLTCANIVSKKSNESWKKR